MVHADVTVRFEECENMTTTTNGSLTTDGHSRPDRAEAMTPSICGEGEHDYLVVRHLGLVRRVCARFRNSGEPMEDLIQVGSVGLLKAVAKYDPELGSNFVAYAMPVIVGEIKNYFRDHGWAVKIPRKLQSRKLAVARAVEVLNQKLGRSPTVNEIAGAAGFTEQEVYQTFEVELFGKPVSLDTDYSSAEGDDSSTILDYVGSVDPELEALADKLDLDQAMSHLDDREKAIIYMYYYKGASQTEIAERLALSQMHVSRLQRGALGKLEQALTGKPS